MGLLRRSQPRCDRKTGNEGFEGCQFRQVRELACRRSRDSSINLPSIKDGIAEIPFQPSYQQFMVCSTAIYLLIEVAANDRISE
jgi:hypothetical protein